MKTRDRGTVTRAPVKAERIRFLSRTVLTGPAAWVTATVGTPRSESSRPQPSGCESAYPKKADGEGGIYNRRIERSWPSHPAGICRCWTEGRDHLSDPKALGCGDVLT